MKKFLTFPFLIVTLLCSFFFASCSAKAPIEKSFTFPDSFQITYVTSPSSSSSKVISIGQDKNGNIYKETIANETFIYVYKGLDEYGIKRVYDLYPTGAGNGFCKGGMFGQQLVMVPDTGRVAAWHCAGGNGTVDLVRWVSEYKD